MSSTDGEWFLVQTNYDHALPMPPWDDRKRPAEKAMKDIGSDAITPAAIYKEVLSLDPVLNKLTVYSTYMACSAGAYESRVRDCKSCSPFR
jgi:acid ceramidase/N-acylethanolamine-hydrolysing acid amidase